MRKMLANEPLNDNDTRIVNDDLYYTLTRVAAQALPGGFPGKAHAHRFRHSFGSNLIRAGVNIKVVQTLMRHENIQMTLDIYGHIMDSDAEDAIVKTFP